MPRPPRRDREGLKRVGPGAARVVVDVDVLQRLAAGCIAVCLDSECGDAGSEGCRDGEESGKREAHDE